MTRAPTPDGTSENSGATGDEPTYVVGERLGKQIKLSETTMDTIQSVADREEESFETVLEYYLDTAGLLAVANQIATDLADVNSVPESEWLDAAHSKLAEITAQTECTADEIPNSMALHYQVTGAYELEEKVLSLAVRVKKYESLQDQREAMAERVAESNAELTDISEVLETLEELIDAIRLSILDFCVVHQLLYVDDDVLPSEASPNPLLERD